MSSGLLNEYETIPQKVLAEMREDALLNRWSKARFDYSLPPRANKRATLVSKTRKERGFNQRDWAGLAVDMLRTTPILQTAFQRVDKLTRDILRNPEYHTRSEISWAEAREEKRGLAFGASPMSARDIVVVKFALHLNIIPRSLAVFLQGLIKQNHRKHELPVVEDALRDPEILPLLSTEDLKRIQRELNRLRTRRR